MTKFAVLIYLFLCYSSASTQRFPVINDGNDNTPIAHLKYIASLQLVTTEEEFFCAGVFISRKAVLTLATCFYQKDVLLSPDEVRVVAGSQFRLDRERNTFSEVLSEIAVHENFSRSSLENNLAIGFLSSEVSADNNIDVIGLDDMAARLPSEGTKCDIFGWSLTTSLDVPHLLSGEVEIESREKCDVAINKLTSTTICAGPYFVNGCHTDDGSPLVCNKLLQGLIDYRSPDYCSMIITNRLGTYVDLSSYRDWLSEHSASSARAIIIVIPLMILSAVLLNLAR